MNKLSNVKIGFFGTPDFSLQFLKYLFSKNFLIKFVVSQPASKSGRGKKTNLSPVEKWSLEKKIPTFTPNNLSDERFLQSIRKISVDFIIVVAYGNLVNEEIIDHPKFLTINVHASLLPKWRGAAPVQRSIMNLDKETGISIMKIVEKLDAGPVIQQDKINLNENIDTSILSKLLSQLGAKSLMNVIEKLEKNEITFVEQNHNEATYAKKITKEEAELKWNQNANIILAKINGLNPNPGAWFKYKNERYKVWKAKISNTSGLQGSTIDNNLTIACKDKSISILEIQKEGKSRQSTDQFLLGSKIPKGEKIV